MAWQVKVTFGPEGGRADVGYVDPVHAAEEDAGYRRRRTQGPRQVVFTDDSTGWARIAAALFESMVHPDLAHAVADTQGTDSRLAELARDIRLELANEEAPRAANAGQARLSIRLTSAALQLTDRMEWKVPHPSGASPQSLREALDELRQRVWRLVAREGWYRLQPGRRAPPRPRVDAGVHGS